MSSEMTAVRVHLAGQYHRTVDLPLQFDEAADAYEASDAFTVDALQWVADDRALPAELVEVVLEHYRGSAAYNGVVADIQAGDR